MTPQQLAATDTVRNLLRLQSWQVIYTDLDGDEPVIFAVPLSQGLDQPRLFTLIDTLTLILRPIRWRAMLCAQATAPDLIAVDPIPTEPDPRP